MRSRRDGLSSTMDNVTSEYRAARANRWRSQMRGLASGGSGADWHYRNEGDFFRLMEEARYCDRNNRVVGQGVNRLVNLVLKTGLKYDAATGDDALDDEIKGRWLRWSTTPALCDARGRSTVDGLAGLGLRHVVVDGDFCFLPLRERMLQGIEAHRMVTPRNVRNNRRNRKVIHGVEQNRYGRAIRYWITKENMDPWAVERVGQMEQYDAFDAQGNPQVFHLFKPDRVSQSRGVTAFARMLEDAEQHDDLQFATLVKAQVAACFAIFREQSHDAIPSSGAAAAGALGSELLSDGSLRVLEQIAPGMDITGRPGEKLQGFAPNVPNASFFEHAMMILTFVSINLGIPVMALMLDPRETNFSGWRGAMDMAQHGFRDIRSWLTTQFYRPTYEWWLRGELAADPALRRAAGMNGVNIFGHQFKPPYDGYIEPVKDVQADEKLVAGGLDSRRNVLARRGVDLDEVDRDRLDDARRWLLGCIEAAVEISSAHPESGITWRDVSLAAGVVSNTQMPVGAAAVDSGPLTDDSGDDEGDDNKEGRT